MSMDFSEEIMSAEKFTKTHPALIGAIGVAVRKELEAHDANGARSGNVQCPLDLGQITSDGRLVFRKPLDCISQCDECFSRIAPHRSKLGILSGINRLPFHEITSLLIAGGAIVSLLILCLGNNRSLTSSRRRS